MNKWVWAQHLSSVVASFVVLGSSCALAQSRGTQANFEKPAVLQVKDVLPEALIKGPFHEVDSRVSNDGYFNEFRVRSKFGNFTVEGQQFLELRIGELNALNELDQLSSSKVIGDAVYEGGKATVLAPVNVVKKVANTVSDPDKMYDTVKAVPEGAEKVFSWAYRQAKGAARGVSDLVTGDSETSSQDVSDGTTSTLQAGKSFGLKFIGYTSRERELFRKLQVNPYSSNQVLQDEVVRVAGLGTAVGFAFRFVPGLGLLGQLSTFNRWYGRAEQLSLYEDPDVIKEKNKAELRALEVPDEMIEQFQSSKVYNPWTRRFVTASMTALGPTVAGRALFIKAALQAKNEPSTLYFVSVAEYFEKVQKETPLKKIVSSLYIPAGVTKKGVLIVPLSVDYLYWTKEVAGIFDDFRDRVTKEESFSSVEMRIRGRVSRQARTALEALGAKVFENSWK
ncbi:MAG: hypothetical protein RL518_1452 [Pseudomonadota bacterium]